jgi:hypothetical protein
MSPKAILITFLVVSLLLIGMMFLIVDVRNNSVLDSQKITNVPPQIQDQTEALQDSLKREKTSQNSQDIDVLNKVADDVVANINILQEALFPGGLAAHDISKSPEVNKNNAVFFRHNGDYSDQATRFVATISTFENTIRSLQRKYPALKDIKTTIRDAHSGNTDWLSYNFKDFPAVASHAKLSVLLNTMKTKKEEIITKLLTNR